ncbi:MAG: contractile injection system sheath initiator [Desulfitobacteriaceae bacterium]
MGADPFIGVDIRLRKGDLGYTQTGDLDLIGNVDPLENMWQAVELRLNTIRGKYYFIKKFGSNLGTYVEEPLTDNLAPSIEADAKNAILEDPRIASLANFNAVIQANSITLNFTITTATGQSKSGSVTI